MYSFIVGKDFFARKSDGKLDFRRERLCHVGVVEARTDTTLTLREVRYEAHTVPKCNQPLEGFWVILVDRVLTEAYLSN